MARIPSPAVFLIGSVITAVCVNCVLAQVQAPEIKAAESAKSNPKKGGASPVPAPKLAADEQDSTSEGRFSADSNEPIDDLAMMNQLEADGEALAATGRTVSAHDLQTQLSRTKTQLSLTTKPGRKLSREEVYVLARRSTVVVAEFRRERPDEKWTLTAASSGFIVAPSVVATNYHVMELPDEDKLSKQGSQMEVFYAVLTANNLLEPVTEVLAADRAQDVALVRLLADDESQLPPALPVAATRAVVGSWIGVVGHPDGRFFSYSDGMVTRYMRLRDEEDEATQWMTTTADIAEGSSGSAAINERGEVVGMASSTEHIHALNAAEVAASGWTAVFKPLIQPVSSDPAEVPQQMVVRNYVPATAIRSLIEQEPASE